MDSFYKFASDSPILTFFLFIIVGNTIVGLVRAITGKCKCSCEDDNG